MGSAGVDIYVGGSGAGREGRGGGNLGVIVVPVCEQVFRNLPHSYTWSSKKNVPIHTLDNPKC